ncbi:hypothetical protein GEMRC1_007444 [Eukaryota sp. GEM-RC1]
MSLKSQESFLTAFSPRSSPLKTPVSRRSLDLISINSPIEFVSPRSPKPTFSTGIVLKFCKNNKCDFCVVPSNEQTLTLPLGSDPVLLELTNEENIQFLNYQLFWKNS